MCDDGADSAEGAIVAARLNVAQIATEVAISRDFMVSSPAHGYEVIESLARR